MRDLTQWLHLREWATTQAEEWNADVLVTCSDGVTLMLRTDVPSSRIACPTVRPCGHVRCEWHLWRIEASDRGGRPWESHEPTASLQAVWKQSPVPASCGLDLIEHARARGEQGVPTETIARSMGRDESLMRRIVRRALIKLRARGVGPEDMRALLEGG